MALSCQQPPRRLKHHRVLVASQRLRKALQPRLNQLRRPLHCIRKSLAAQQRLIHAVRRCRSNQPLTARSRTRAQELIDQSLSQPFTQLGSRGLAGLGRAHDLGIKRRGQAPHGLPPVWWSRAWSSGWAAKEEAPLTAMEVPRKGLRHSGLAGRLLCCFLSHARIRRG